MSAISELGLPLGNAPTIVSNDPHLLTAWESINVWSQKMVEAGGEKNVSLPSACFILMACKLVNLRLRALIKDGSANAKMQAARIIKKMQDVSARLQRSQALTDWLAGNSSLRASVNVADAWFKPLYQQMNQYAATQPVLRDLILPAHRVWKIISLLIEVAPEPQVIKSKDVNIKLSWLQSQLNKPSKRPHSDDDEKEKGKKARTAATEATEAMKRIEVTDLNDLEIIKRYDNNIGIVPTDGPIKNRSVVTAYDVATLMQGQWVNDAAIDAYLTLVCHTFNGLFQDGAELSKSPRYHAWSTTMTPYLAGRSQRFEEKHLRKEWPPARFPDAVLEDVFCHIFPLHVKGNHWVLLVLQKADDGQWTLFFFSRARLAIRKHSSSHGSSFLLGCTSSPRASLM